MITPELQKAYASRQELALQRKLPVTLLKISLTILLLTLLIWTIGWHALAETLFQTNVWWLLMLYAMTLLGMGVHALRLLAVLRLVGLQLRFRRVFLANALSALYTFILPGDLLAGVAKWANLSAATGQAVLVLSAIIYNRMVFFLSTLIVGALAVAVQNPFPDVPIAGFAIFLAIGLIVGAFIALHPRSAPFLDRLIALLSRILPAFIEKWVALLIDSLDRFRAFAVTDHLRIFLLCVLPFIVSLAGFVFANRAVGVELPMLTLIWINALLLIARLLPITISNLGVREGLLIVIMGAYGIEPAEALTIGLILFTSSFVNATVGIFYQFALIVGLAQWSVPTVERSPGALSSLSLKRIHKPSPSSG